MEEKRNYVVFNSYNDTENVFKMTSEQARAVAVIIAEVFDCEGGIELAEDYEGREI